MSTSSPRPSGAFRIAAYVAAPVLALGALAAVPAPSYAVDDPSPATNGAAWLAGQLTDGLIFNDQFDFNDLGLTVDAGLGLAETGDDATVSTIAGALAPVITEYYTYDVAAGKTHVSAGSLAKAARFAQIAGVDATDFGGQDLIAQLDERVSAEGRLSDVFFPEEPFESDFSNTIGQSFAVAALDEADSPEVTAATSFLLDQQCADGFFRLAFSAPGLADQTCDGDPESSASTDVTGLALINLAAISDPSPQVEQAITDGVTWLLETQGADGSWASDDAITDPNANSTGLAGWALRGVDTPEATAAATEAATYLRTLQADDFAPCTTGLTGDTGVVAYDPAALSKGRAEGITEDVQDQFRRATAQALPALLTAPAADTATFRTDPVFAQPRSTQILDASNLAPGRTVCFAGPGARVLDNADATGFVLNGVTLPAGTAKRVYRLRDSDGVAGVYVFRALGKKKFTVTPRAKRVPVNRKQRITVRGLVRGESLTVRYQGRVIDRAVARKRTYTTRFDVVRTKGKQRVQVFGEFGNRNGATTFRVTKRR